MIAFHYVEAKNPGGTGFVQGVPHEDLSYSFYRAQPPHIRAMIRAAPYYQPASEDQQPSATEEVEAASEDQQAADTEEVEEATDATE